MSDKLRDKNIVEEMQNSFLDYAMSVIVSRALPDVRDGLKPVHRRILFAMNDLGNYADKPYKKSARIVGDCIGKYHPHGDSSVYDAMVRMAQDFSYREMLVDGHGNFGSLDGDGAAAMRYTEARMSRIAMEMLKDINKNTIDFQENYDASELEPVVLPGKIPNLLVNGASGIAVGMATNIPPHNLGEVINGIIAYMNDKDINTQGLMQYIKGPDFPLGADILGSHGIIKAYETGNGSVKVRSKYDLFEEDNGKYTIVFTEIPFQVNKAVLVEKIADAVKDKRVEGITDLRDESDREGIRIVIELKRGVTPEVIINNLFKMTQLEATFSINMLALVDGEPKVLTLKEIIENYVLHQKDVITRKTQFELDKAQTRIHILDGLKIAVDNIDEVIKIIRSSKTTDEAKAILKEKYNFSDEQTKAILEMRLQKLTGLEIDKLVSEIEELTIEIEKLEAILASEQLIEDIITEELNELKEKYSNPRRTNILEGYFDSSIDVEDLIEEEDIVITLTDEGYIKRMTPENYRVQNRGGKGVKGMKTNEEDIVKHIVSTTTHTDVLFFTNTGKVYKTRAHRIPEFSKTSKGIPLVNLIDLDKEEHITNIISIKDYVDNTALMFVTRNGIGKKTNISEYIRVNKNGKRALTLKEEDSVVSVFMTTEEDNILISSKYGNSILLSSSDIRNMGRTSTGVKVMKFKVDGDYIISGSATNTSDLILTVTTLGYGKMTKSTEYRLIKRGGKGIRNIKLSEKNGSVAMVKIISEDEIVSKDLLLITETGQTIRVKVSDFPIISRSTQGVRIMKLSEGEEIVNIEIIDGESTEETNEN